MTKRQKRWAIGLGSLLFLAFAGYFALTKVVDHYLQDGALDRTLGEKTAFILKADAGYLPLSWRGWTVRSGGLLIRGKPPRGLSELRAANLRATCSLRDLWQRKSIVKRLRADRLEVAFGAAAAEQLTPILPAQPELQPQVETPSLLKVEIRETIVDQTDVFWGTDPEGRGALRGVLTKFHPNGSALDGIGTGGTVRQSGWPELRVLRVETHYAKPRLEVRSATFAIGKEQDTTATGQFDFSEGGGGLNLHVQAKSAPVEPFLKGFWRGKFEGKITGDAQLEKKFKPDTKTSAAGELKILGAELHDVPMLDVIAALTRHPEFAHLKLSELRCRYAWTGDRLKVSGLRAEAKGLFRIEGDCVLENKQIDGSFEIGATAEVLKSIPCAREKVFTATHDGYFWTTVKLSGPLKHPREDLKERLVAAAQEELAKGFLAPLLKPGQGILELLKSLYE
ncbi:MAG: hypothetical protein ABIR29_13245 [Chthoniobacterales bacterium]